MIKVVRTRARRSLSIAGRARRLASEAQIEWQELALRLGVDQAISAAVDSRRERVAALSEQLAQGAYRVDADAVAACLIARLLRQARSASH